MGSDTECENPEDNLLSRSQNQLSSSSVERTAHSIPPLPGIEDSSSNVEKTATSQVIHVKQEVETEQLDRFVAKPLPPITIDVSESEEDTCLQHFSEYPDYSREIYS